MNPKLLLIGGHWRATDNVKELRAPYSGETLASVSYASRTDVEEAIAVAASATQELRVLARYEIADALRGMADYINERREEFARSISLESGKPIRAARGETDRTISTFAFAAEEARRFIGEAIPMPYGGVKLSGASRARA